MPATPSPLFGFLSKKSGRKAKDIAVNLVPKDPFFASPIGKVLKWALSVGRYIVIFTELIVILSFITRFNLDRQVTDLNETINQKKVIIESFGELETNVRMFQAKTDAYHQIKQQSNIADIFPILSRITPQNIKLEELQIKPGKIAFRGTATTQGTFNTLVTNMELSPEFAEVKVGSVGSGETNEPGIQFSIEAVVVPQTTAAPTNPGRSPWRHAANSPVS